MIDGNRIMEKARKLAELENMVQCPKLFQFAVQNDITLRELRDEIRYIISMPDEEVDVVSEQMK